MIIMIEKKWPDHHKKKLKTHTHTRIFQTWFVKFLLSKKMLARISGKKTWTKTTTEYSDALFETKSAHFHLPKKKIEKSILFQT